MSLATPPTTEQGIGAIADKHRWTYQEAVFACLKRLGCSTPDAYQAIKPKVTRRSATEHGARWVGRLRNTYSAIPIQDAITALGDIVAVDLAITSEDEGTRLAAARELSKLAGRYERNTTVSDLAALMTALSTPNQAQIKGEPDTEFVAEIAETVDLTRPENESGSQ